MAYLSCCYTDSVAHFRHLYTFRSVNVVSTSHAALFSVIVGGREARTCPSAGEQSLVLHVSRYLFAPWSDPADGGFDGAVVLPYTLSSQFSTLISLVILGRRANSRMVYLSSRAGSVHEGGRPAFVVSSRPEGWVSIISFYACFHMMMELLRALDIVLTHSDMLSSHVFDVFGLSSKRLIARFSLR